MSYILIISFLFIVLIGVAYYLDYKKNKKYFNKSIKNLGSLIVIILAIYVFSELINMILE
ncbi:hypothetical protein B8T70_00385 [Flavobacterium sp. AJR]|jgi:hypothetical protein|nr:hypothetical protein OA93_16295 [Flavobacterium sp. KMS]OUL64424.1 hypothetical protein B8T70_00385 [Flavobacterium sp. AJR]